MKATEVLLLLASLALGGARQTSISKDGVRNGAAREAKHLPTVEICAKVQTSAWGLLDRPGRIEARWLVRANGQTYSLDFGDSLPPFGLGEDPDVEILIKGKLELTSWTDETTKLPPISRTIPNMIPMIPRNDPPPPPPAGMSVIHVESMKKAK